METSAAVAPRPADTTEDAPPPAKRAKLGCHAHDLATASRTEADREPCAATGGVGPESARPLDATSAARSKDATASPSGGPARGSVSGAAAPRPLVRALKKTVAELQALWLEIVHEARAAGVDEALLPTAETIVGVRAAPDLGAAAAEAFDSIRRELMAQLESVAVQHRLSKVSVWQAMPTLAAAVGRGAVATYSPVADIVRQIAATAGPEETTASLFPRVPWTAAEFLDNLRALPAATDSHGRPIAGLPLFAILQAGDMVLELNQEQRAALAQAAAESFAVRYGNKDAKAYVPRIAELETLVMAARGPALSEGARVLVTASALTMLVNRWLLAPTVPSRKPTRDADAEVKQCLVRAWPGLSSARDRYVCAWAMCNMALGTFTDHEIARYQVPSLLMAAVQLLKRNSRTVQACCIVGAASAANSGRRRAAADGQDGAVPAALRALAAEPSISIEETPIAFSLHTRKRPQRARALLDEWRAFVLSPRGFGYLVRFLSLPDADRRIRVTGKARVWLYLLREAFLNPAATDVVAETFFVNTPTAALVATELVMSLGFVAGDGGTEARRFA